MGNAEVTQLLLSTDGVDFMIESTPEKNYAISTIRTFSMLLIVLCHIFQSYGNRICFYLNIAVYFFLYISGYLYGKKRIENYGVFLKNRIVRVLIPYYLVLGVLIVVNKVLGQGDSIANIAGSLLCVQWYGHTIQNSGHLWYVSCIIVCYCLLPLLQKMKEHIESYRKTKYALILYLISIGLQLLDTFNAISQTAVYMICFITGYMISGSSIEEEIKRKKRLIPVWALGGFLLYCSMCYVEVNLGIAFHPLFVSYSKLILTVLVFHALLNTQICSKNSKVISYLDRYSYEVYLCHHLFILGKLSVMNMTDNKLLNCIIALICTGVFAFITHGISNLLAKQIEGRFCK